MDAAIAAADRQQMAGESEAIRYQTADGKWHDEMADGEDRPETEIEDELVEPSPNGERRETRLP